MVFNFGLHNTKKQDYCKVLQVTNKKNYYHYYKKRGVHSTIKMKNGYMFKSPEWLDFDENRLHITKGFNSSFHPYVGDTVICLNDIKWVLWDGVPRKKLRTSKYAFKVLYIQTDCEYRGWNHKYFQTETKMEDCNCI